MALPTIAEVNTAFDDLFAVAAEDKTKAGTRALVANLARMADWLKRRYVPVLAVDLTDSADAGVAEAIAADGELGLAYAAAGLGLTFPVGAIFEIAGTTEDFTDNALATAKSGAVAAADLFQVSGADEVTYLGNTGTPLSFAAEEIVDIVWPA